MTLVLVFLLAVATVALVWLWRNGVMSKPWLESGVVAVQGPGFDAPRLGLGVFLLVIGALFVLFGSAFVMRMELEAWSGFALPPLVWINTALLAAASLLLHGVGRGARTGAGHDWRRDAALAALLTVAFLAGQVLAWRQLSLGGGGLTTGPAASFFYLLSGLHGLHILGGLTALCAALARGRGGRPGPGIGLCTTYWDFMLVVWIGLLVLFMGWANQIAAICRGVLT